MPVTLKELADAHTMTETAEILGCSYRSVQRLIARGEIEYSRFGSGPRAPVFITDRALTDYLNRNLTKRVAAGHHPTATRRRTPSDTREDRTK